MDERAHPRWRLTRRGLLKRGGALGAGLSIPGLSSAVMSASAMAALRSPDSLPDPSRPAGTATGAMPFDHLVCVMMENHSFDNLLGALPRLGQPKADRLTFDSAGQATNTSPSSSGTVTSYELTNTEQPGSVTRTWNATHQQIDGGKMDGFVESLNSTEAHVACSVSAQNSLVASFLALPPTLPETATSVPAAPSPALKLSFTVSPLIIREAARNTGKLHPGRNVSELESSPARRILPATRTRSVTLAFSRAWASDGVPGTDRSYVNDWAIAILLGSGDGSRSRYLLA